MKLEHWSKALPATACANAVAWARKQKSAAIAWRECRRGDWMLWLIGKLEKSEPYSEERKPLVRMACGCARSAWEWMPEKSRAALETVERWTRGEASAEDCKNAAAHAAAAADAAAYAYAAAARAAYAADAADAADAAPARAVAAAAYAYAAAHAAADAYAYAAAYATYSVLVKAQEHCADIVRKHYPKAPRLR